jgi:CheY-like chemotaxis protein
LAIGYLLENALKFTDAGEISISAKKFDPQLNLEVVLFCISDTGIGIPKEQQKRVFDSFVQQDSSTTRKYGGTGLGLSICKQIVNAMGGDIWITGEPGKGGSFFFTTSLMPLSNSISKHKKDIPTLRGNLSHSLKILIVEDEVLIRTLLNEYLSNSPHRITNAINGQEAVELVQSNEFDLVIMDLRMPVMDGYSATQKIRSWETRQFRKPLPIVALSASVMVEDVEQCLSSGFNSHLGKPSKKINYYK